MPTTKHTRNSIEVARVLASAKGGKCLSTSYKNGRELLDWQCGLGHPPWQASLFNVKNGGTWCPTCGHSIRGNLDQLRAVAIARGGACLSSRLVNFHVRLRWRCAQGHEWMASPNNVLGRGRKPGTWCPKCAIARRRGRKRGIGSIEDMRRLAQSRGGRCVSESYVNARTPLQWACSEDHTWMAKPSNIRYGSWCPYCSKKAPRDIDEMRELARRRGGDCLSAIMVNVHSPLRWRCAEGHEFESMPRIVLRGHWCPFCANTVPATLEEMRLLAAQHGGECLSARYVNALSPLRWRCAQGHEWLARPNSVKSGNWCLKCYRERGESSAR